MKRILCIFQCALLAVSLCGCSLQKEAEESASDSNDEAKSLCAFTVSQGQLLDFMNSPSLEYLKVNGYNPLIYTLSADNHDAVIVEPYNDRSAWKREISDDDDAQYGAMHNVRTELIRKLGNESELSKLLKNAGIDGEIKNYAIVSTPQTTDFLWVELNNKSCYAEISFLGAGLEEEYELCFFSENEFKDKVFGADGRVIVNGTDLEDKAYVNFFDNGVGFEVIPIMQELGAEIEWLDDNTAKMVCMNKSYTYYSDELKLVEDSKADNLLLVLMAGTSRAAYTIDDKIVVDEYAMQTFAQLMGAELRISKDTLTATVSVP
ncbi:MAG: hypothetical protein Q4A83_05485 [Bacillota bacterium]|nr:hypothetical protein [Bacillota bacterium]